MIEIATSGAGVGFFDKYVVKVGEPGPVGDRVAEQAAWLQRHESPALPKVFMAWHDGYIMERLRPIEWRHIDTWTWLVEDVFAALRKHVWSLPAEVEVDWDRHRRFIQERCELAAPEAAKPLSRWLDDVETLELRSCLIHGDPTFDNTCRRLGRRLVFIDPNPARPEVPSLEVCDAANVMQSLHGYEHLKYGRPMPNVSMDVVRTITGYDPDEWFALQYFTAAKFARLLAYETDLRPVFRDVLLNLLRQGGFHP